MVAAVVTLRCGGVGDGSNSGKSCCVEISNKTEDYYNENVHQSRPHQKETQMCW